jgi:hypothetical protein
MEEDAMNQSEITSIRLSSQGITAVRGHSVGEIVAWMGAMQAQDAAMSRWAVGVRLPGATEQTVQSAMDRGEIFRTHVLRPTWHLVSADDIYWMLDLTTPFIRTTMDARHEQLGLTDEVLTRSRRVLEKSLRNGSHLTREELVAVLEAEHILNEDNRASHVLMLAEQEGLICSGPSRNGKRTYALLEELRPKPASLPREEALAKLARRYLRSRGPATLPDFIWWSGLPVRDARLAFDLVRAEFHSETMGGQTWLFPEPASPAEALNPGVQLLPAFDEYLIAYRDRSACLPEEHFSKAVSNNGIFWPILVIDGQVAGTWSRSFKKSSVEVVIHPFTPLSPDRMDDVKQAAISYAKYTGKSLSDMRI